MKKRLKKISTKAKDFTPKLRHPVKHLRTRREARKEVTTTTVVPYITNDTIAEHREEVLKGARKYIYPLQHSKHRIVLISSVIFTVTIISLFTYGAIALYKLQSASTFVYRISQVVPFPVAKTKSQYISYESYLFELRHYMHYYESQQKLTFKTPEGQQQLIAYKQRALDRVINDAYVKQLAKQHGVSVKDKEVDLEIEIVRAQNRLGNSNQVFEDVLRDFWGWSLSDFKRSLRQQLLARKVVSKLDTGAHERAEAALAELRSGVPFADVAKKYSEELATKDLGGEYVLPVDRSNRDIAAQTTEAIFATAPGQYSEIIDTGYSLEIVKTNSIDGDKAKAAHIQFNFKDISEYINPLKDEQKAKVYINI